MDGWNAVYDHLLTLVPTFTGMDEVYDGPPLEETTPNGFAVIGDDGAGDGGFLEQSEPQSDTFVVETGTVQCLFVAQSGDESVTALRATFKGWMTALRADFHADPTLGGAL